MTHFYIGIKTYEPSNLDMSRVSLGLLGRRRPKKPADEIVSTARTSHITHLRRGVAEDSTGPPAVKPRGSTIKRDQIGDRLFEGIRGLISQFMSDGRRAVPGAADELGQLLCR
jgi:hypothetical protein